MKSAALQSFWVGYVLCCLKQCLNFDGLSWQEKVGQHFPMNCFKFGHSYEAFTYLFGRNIFIRRLSASKNCSVDLLKLSGMGNFGLSKILLTSFLQVSKQMNSLKPKIKD